MLIFIVFMAYQPCAGYLVPESSFFRHPSRLGLSKSPTASPKRGKKAMSVLRHDAKQSDGEAPVVQEISRMLNYLIIAVRSTLTRRGSTFHVLIYR